VSYLKPILSKSVFDFSFLFGSNLLNKILGFVREIILAFFFGSSLIYSSYLLLKTLTDFLSKFTFGNALQANILPKFTRLYEKNKTLNLNLVYVFSKKTCVFLFFSSLVLQLLVIFFLIKDFQFILILTAIILSVILSVNFHNSLFLNIIQAEGNFKKFSFAELSNGIISTFFIYPLSLFLSIVGIALSRLFGILTLAYFYINPIVKSNNGYIARVSLKDFNFSVVFLSNLYLFVFLIARFISGLNSSSDIAFFNYSFLLLNVFMTAIIFNVNSILLRQISIKKNLKYFYYTIFISVILSIILYLVIKSYSPEIVSLIFLRGAFNESDVLFTAFFLRQLTTPFILLVFSTIFFQPFFSLGVNRISKICLNYSLILFIILTLVLLYIIINQIDTQKACFLFINIMSFSSIVISIFSFRYFLSHEI
jgi:putative peptidoglycan lipid II flippase